MLRRKTTTPLIITLAFFLSALVVSCDLQPPAPAPTPTPESTHAVGTLFAKFYNILGGSEVLGDPISPVFEKSGLSYQYTTASLMAYDPTAPANRRFLLAPLGFSMQGIAEKPVPNPNTSGTRYVGGHIVYPEFVPLYDVLGGENVVGQPLMEAHFNAERNRIEQYFENLGFYLPGGDPGGSVRLLAYGAWMCGDLCGPTFPPLNSIIDVPKAPLESAPSEEQEPGQVEPELEAECCFFYVPFIAQNATIQEAFNKALGWFKFNLPIIHRALPDRLQLREAVNRLGSDFTGFALSDPYLTADGKLEQIFENVVLRVDAQQKTAFELRPLPGLLGISRDPLESPSDDPAMEFYAIEGDQGFNVPAYFWHYLDLHGGQQVSGPPITSLKPLDDRVYWQCFENFCLEEHRVTPDGLLIRPVALGYQYKEHFYRPPETQLPEPPGKELSIQVWESSPFVASNQEQQIEVSVQENNNPLPGVAPVLTLTRPDNSQKIYNFTATGQNGRTSLRLPPIQATNSALVQYQICIPGQNGDKFCVKDSYLIWNNP